MKKIIAMLCCAAALTWAGCSDDDDTDKVDMSLLTGKWEVTKQYDGELDRWYENFGEASGFVQTIELRTDGTGTEKTIEIYQEQVYTYEYDFTYTVHGKTITMTYEEDEEYPSTGYIEKLTSDELVVASSYEGEDGRTYTDKEYFQRIG